LLIWIIWEKN